MAYVLVDRASRGNSSVDLGADALGHRCPLSRAVSAWGVASASDEATTGTHSRLSSNEQSRAYLSGQLERTLVPALRAAGA
jgi:hypothetical protein